MKKLLLLAIICLAAVSTVNADYSKWVDPRIGSEGLGRVFIGPSMPFGMIKPSPDGVSMPNSGWAPMPEPIKGFSQVHVSGTGGGQKYGNILIMPFTGVVSDYMALEDVRHDETISLGYYATLLESGINVEITAADKAAIYRIVYPKDASQGLVIDAGAFLGMSPIPDQRETQQFVGSQIEIVSDTEIRGYNRVRGGWNNGPAYTVYFYAVADRPFTKANTWKGEEITDMRWQSDTHLPTGAVLRFANDCDTIKLKIAISYMSELKAKENLMAEIPDFNFERTYTRLIDKWNSLLSRIDIASTAADEQRKMFYTALYHTMIMPTDRSGENPLWADDDTYYDDFYAIWDTYRTSSPLITLIDPAREVDMVNSLLNIYKRDGYMPDARSGNANGRTQGGSNAEIVIADAYVKGLKGIDYELALQAMLKDADVPPGGNEEAEGRGGLVEYNTLGYVPFGIDRAGNRTVEYSYCDYAIAQVAKGLSEDAIYDRFMGQSANWKNLWREDYEHSGVKGFIMPKDREGNWLDSLPQGHSQVYTPKYEYTAMSFEGPWYTPWWSMFFYEAPSWEYSLSIPHDVPGLIEMCGGQEAFEHRLDTFFDRGFYNVNNEPSFLTPCLYHWIGKPWKSCERIHQIICDNYSDGPMGLPGNDDSGAMSSWLAFHLIGLYPNAGQDYYLINTPLLENTTFHLPDGNDFTVTAENFNASNKYIVKAELNGSPYPYSSLKHTDIINGGVLKLTLGNKPSEWGNQLAPQSEIPIYDRPSKLSSLKIEANDPNLNDLLFVFKLHGQTRRYKMNFDRKADGDIVLTWGIQRNLKWQEGTYTMTAEAVNNGDILNLNMPIDGQNVILPNDNTAYIISKKALSDLLSTGKMKYNNTTFSLVSKADGLLHAIDEKEGAEMWILDNPELPIVWAMQNNPLEVDWMVNSK